METQGNVGCAQLSPSTVPLTYCQVPSLLKSLFYVFLFLVDFLSLPFALSLFLPLFLSFIICFCSLSLSLPQCVFLSNCCSAIFHSLALFRSLSLSLSLSCLPLSQSHFYLVSFSPLSFYIFTFLSDSPAFRLPGSMFDIFLRLAFLPLHVRPLLPLRARPTPSLPSSISKQTHRQTCSWHSGPELLSL